MVKIHVKIEDGIAVLLGQDKRNGQNSYRAVKAFNDAFSEGRITAPADINPRLPHWPICPFQIVSVPALVKKNVISSDENQFTGEGPVAV